MAKLQFRLAFLFLLLIQQQQQQQQYPFASARILSDLKRARTLRPAPEFQAASPGHLAATLNGQLQRMAAAHRHRTVPCEELPLPQLRQMLLDLHALAAADPLAPALTAIYEMHHDPRQLRSDMASPESQESASAADRADRADDPTLTAFGLCYDGALLYAHHLSQATKRTTANISVPLLPQPHNAERVMAHVQQHKPPLLTAQVVCSRCHLLPNITAQPTQSTYVSPGAHPPLLQPPSVSSQGGELNTTLVVTAGRMAGPVSFNARLYNGSAPGPTLRVRAGDRLNVRLVNSLSEPLSCRATRSGGGADSNFYRCPNVTNLHAHGLWVAPQDVYSGVFPGEAREYTYNLTVDHAAGTNWYHPHFHGSVSLQLANGMAGMIVVEDDPAALPPALRAMQDVPIVLQSIEYFNYTADDITCPVSYDAVQHVNMSHCHDLDGAGSLKTIRAFASDNMPLNLRITDPAAGSPIGGVYFLANGAYQPVASLRPGEWQRWRILNAGHQSSLSVVLPNCTTLLIAMDDAGMYLLLSRENPDPQNLGNQEGFDSGVLMLVNVSGPNMQMQAPTALPPRPGYLRDLRGVPATSPPFNVSWDIVRMYNNTAGLTDVPIYGMSGVPFDASLAQPMACFEQRPGAVAEVRVQNPIWLCNASEPLCPETMSRDEATRGAVLADYQHPVSLSHGLHMHTFKFQVVGDSNGGASLDYEVGDFRDTVTTPMAGEVVVRFEPSTFLGLVPMHCHMSPHSDRGMIAVAEVRTNCPQSQYTPRTDPLYTFPISTASAAAQQHFTEGITLTFGFAHDAAASFMNESAIADPGCAMCVWGQAYAAGPVINYPSCADASCGQGYAWAQQALALSERQQNLTAKERLLIRAMALRYLPPSAPVSKLPQAFRAYAEALNDTALVASDADVAALYAEAVMILHCVVGGGYVFYNKTTGLPVPEIAQVIGVLEGWLLGPDGSLLPPPRHALVEHLYIHIVEPSAPGFGPNSAGRALGVAERFQERFTSSDWQHIQHMAAHVYLRTGRYGDAVEANKAAHTSDAAWLDHGLLPYGPGHDVAFLVWAANMDGQLNTSLVYAAILRDIYRAAPDRPDGPAGDRGWQIPLTTLVRFGRWADVLAADAFNMPRDWPFMTVVGHYARGVALVRLGQGAAAQAEYAALQAAFPHIPAVYQGFAQMANLTLLAMLQGSGSQGLAMALTLMEEAAGEQESWIYDEPPDWHMPLRACVGQIQLRLERYDDAVATFQQDLKRWIENAYSLFGLAEAMKASGHYSPPEIAAVEARKAKAWARADVPLESACALWA